MRALELATIEQRLERTVAAMQRRVEAIHGALHHLAAVTRVRLEHEAPDAEVRAWAQAQLVTLDEGYVLRRNTVRARTTGDFDPADYVLYVHRRYRDDLACLRRLHGLRDLGRDLQPVRERLGQVAWVYYQDAAGWALSFPQHDPVGTIPSDFDWRSYFTFAAVRPDQNPQRAIQWTPPNVDYGGEGLMVAPSIPLFDHAGDFLGVWSIDVPVASLCDEARLDADAPGHQTFIVDAEGYLVAHPGIETIVADEKGSFVRETMRALEPGLARLDVAAMLAKRAGRIDIDVDGRPHAVVFRVLEGLEWLVITSVPVEGLLEGVRRSFREAFDHLGRGDTSFRLDAVSDTNVQALVDSYNDMADTLQRTLEARATEQRHLQQVQRVQTIGQLAGGIAHDFNNLITVILSSVELLTGTTHEVEAVAAIKEAAERAATLTTQLLSFSRRDLVRPQPVRIDELFGTAERLLRRLMPDDVELEVHAPPEIPCVRADRTQLLQIVINLVINARDAVPYGGRIRLEATTTDSNAVDICVRDDGEGIAADLRERVFEPFFTTKDHGTGLGLSMVREIVRDLGGSIDLKSEVDQGTTVRVRLPTTSDQPASVVLPEARARLEGCRVFVLDDDPLVLDATTAALDRLGCITEGSHDPEEALQLIAESPFDVLLTDVVMPRLGGREVAARAAELAPDTRVVFMSGYTDDDLLRRGYRDGQFPLLRKPFSRRDLVEVLARASDTE